MGGRHLDVLGQAVLSKGAPACNMRSEHFGKATRCSHGHWTTGVAEIGRFCSCDIGEWKNGPAFGMPGIQVDRIHVLKFREVRNDA
ncbi:Pyruvate dehydrogenase E1 component subunit alpha-3 [Arachis hypogaea]|nr:Pyruvate dehydrogenase E1 component subunit alpha-3 [Arachis hypogaea]